MRYIVNVEAAVVREQKYLLIVPGAHEVHAAGMLSLPGGKVEPDGANVAILEVTLRRELREEVGVEVEDGLVYVDSTAFVADDGQPVINIVFLCRHRAGEARPVASDEVAQVVWMIAAEVLADPRTPPWLRRSVELAEQRRHMLL
jgi:ADP-ribose pyrophosphatase YjhB (NUDIX family)